MTKEIVMIVRLPRTVRKQTRKAHTRTMADPVNDILRAAYRRHARSRLTQAAVKHCLGG